MNFLSFSTDRVPLMCCSLAAHWRDPLGQQHEVPAPDQTAAMEKLPPEEATESKMKVPHWWYLNRGRLIYITQRQIKSFQQWP